MLLKTYTGLLAAVTLLATALASPLPTPVPSSSPSLPSNIPRSHINEPPHQDLVPKPKQEPENQEVSILPKLEFLDLLERSEADEASDGRRAELTDSDVVEYANAERDFSGTSVLGIDLKERQALDGVHPNGINAGIGGFPYANQVVSSVSDHAAKSYDSTATASSSASKESQISQIESENSSIPSGIPLTFVFVFSLLPALVSF